MQTEPPRTPTPTHTPTLPKGRTMLPLIPGSPERLGSTCPSSSRSLVLCRSASLRSLVRPQCRCMLLIESPWGPSVGPTSRNPLTRTRARPAHRLRAPGPFVRYLRAEDRRPPSSPSHHRWSGRLKLKGHRAASVSKSGASTPLHHRPPKCMRRMPACSAHMRKTVFTRQRAYEWLTWRDTTTWQFCVNTS
jgi:hypothetical protein